MVRLRHDPACSVAGNGLLRIVQCEFFRLNPTELTWSLQSPTLQIAIVRSAQQCAFTPPNEVVPVTASLPDGTVPETPTVRFPAGSSLSISIVAAFAPAETGANRTGTSSEPPAAMVSGSAKTDGVQNSGDEELILVTVRTHLPLLAKVSDASRNDPMQTGPKSPALAIKVVSSGGGANPDTARLCGLAGSLLNSWTVPDRSPYAVGANRNVTSSASPGSITSGYEATDGARKSGDGDVMLLTSRRHVPVLLSVSASSRIDPRHTGPNSPACAIAVASPAAPRDPVANTSTTGAPGSFVMIRIVAAFRSGAPVGVKATANSMSSPGARLSGVAGLVSTVKSVEPISRCTLEMIRSAAPTFDTSISRNVGPSHTVPNARLSSRLIAIEAPEGLTNANAPRPNVAARNSPAWNTRSNTGARGKCRSSSTLQFAPPS